MNGSMASCLESHSYRLQATGHFPTPREIVDLVRGYGNEAVRSAHHRADGIYALMSDQSHDPILTAARTAEPGDLMH